MKTAFTVAIATILSITASFAQQGNMKFSGLIVDEKNETQLTMVTLYQINSAKGEDMLVVGQEVVEGNQWFDVQLELGQQYQMNIISNIVQETILSIDTNIPAEMAKARHRQALKIDHSFEDQNESNMAYSSVQTIGEIAFSNKAEAFIHDRYGAEGNELTASR